MSKVAQWLQELKLSEDQLQELILVLKPVVEAHDNKAPYDLVEAALKEQGLTKADAQKLLAVFYGKGVYLESFHSWDYKPFALINYIKHLEN